jgi:hypothetical protein
VEESDMENMKVTIQRTLDHLLNRGQIPFTLIAHAVETKNNNEYVIRFYDSRIYSCRFSWKGDEDFDQVVRFAVLRQVSIMNDSYDEFLASHHLTPVGSTPADASRLSLVRGMHN